MEVFDVVDEVKQNFYELLNVTQVRKRLIVLRAALTKFLP